MKYQVDNKNIVQVRLTKDEESNLDDGEYTIEVIQIIGSLILNSPGETDADLIVQCIEENINEIEWDDDTWTEVRLIETGEREGDFLNKYYEIAK
jgi:hypothetical protein